MCLFYTQGLEDVGDTFVAEAEISGVERTCTFASVQRCATALAEGDPTPALQWAEQHMQELQHSPLPFTLHRMYALKVTIIKLINLSLKNFYGT